jgi:hypothetical protein
MNASAAIMPMSRVSISSDRSSDSSERADRGWRTTSTSRDNVACVILMIPY